MHDAAEANAPATGCRAGQSTACELEASPEDVVDSETPPAKSPLALALLHFKWASFLQKAQKHAQAVEHFTQSIANRPSARSHFALGVSLAALRRRHEAADAFRVALELNPHLVAAHTNLAGVLISLRQYEAAEGQCLEALGLEPGCREAVMNLANALRNLGRRPEAIELVWSHIMREEESRATEAAAAPAARERAPSRPPASPAVRCAEWRGRREVGLPLAVVCVKWGSRYDASYVNNLYAGVRRNLPADLRPWRFICYSDSPDGLDERIEVRALPDGFQLWWGKAYLFSEEAQLDGHRVLYLDLDQVIVGSLEDLAAYEGPFALLSTDGIACELAAGGYNSSVLSWEASEFFRPISAALTDGARRFVHRFDHWLEMTVAGPDFWQDLAPGRVLDYTATFRAGLCVGCAEGEEEEAERQVVEAAGGGDPGSLAPAGPAEPPPGAAVVTFPRSPKPHEVITQHEWIRTCWAGETLPVSGYVVEWRD